MWVFRVNGFVDNWTVVPYSIGKMGMIVHMLPNTAQEAMAELEDLDESIRGRLSWLHAHPDKDGETFRDELAHLRVRRHRVENALPSLRHSQPAAVVGDLIAS